MAESINGTPAPPEEDERRLGEEIATIHVTNSAIFLAGKIAAYEPRAGVAQEIFRLAAIYRNTLVAECEKLLGPQDRWNE